MRKRNDRHLKLAEQLLTVAEAAAFLNVSLNTIRALTGRGELSCYRIGGRKERRFSNSQIEAYLAKNAQTPYKLSIPESPVVREPAPLLSSTATLNQGLLIHDWYMMPEAFSEPLILDAMERFGITRGDTILDPFAGTGTTVLAAVLKGINGVGIEVNPFLCFASRVKLTWDIDLDVFRTSESRLFHEAKSLLDCLSVNHDLFSTARPTASMERISEVLSQTTEPDMPRLHKWMSPVVVKKVLILRHLIEMLVAKPVRPHFLLALAAILRPVSNMKLAPHAFGSSVEKEDAPVYDAFAQKLMKMQRDISYLQENRHALGLGEVLHRDARLASEVASDLLPATLAVTSPPYLNNLDYTMQTRMELFFLGFVNDMLGLRDLRKSMVTSDAKAVYRDIHDSDEVKDVPSIQRVAQQLREAHRDKNWGWDYAFMTTQYFGGMLRTLRSVRPLLRRHAHFVIVVGESAHSGVVVPLPEIIGELGVRAGYSCQEINVLRRRRSSSHSFQLCESEVILQKP
jgi:excisionase family DNA binding protein